MHFYFHIPFCTSKCPYCAFGSHKDKFSKVKSYFKALKFELSSYLKTNQNKIKTIFIGGGTPSAVDAGFYEEIFEILRPNLDKNCEITSEANPNSATQIWLETMAKFGTNRISFGAQSFDEKKLKFLGRAHSSNLIYKAVENAKIAGFKNINLDLIYDTKFDTKSLLASEINHIKALKIDHISAYSLTLEENTPFYGKISYKKDSVNLAKFLINELNNLGLGQYEISNFGKICKHNLSYWKLENYAGFGAYSVGFEKNRRFYAPNLEEYLQNPLSKKVEILKDSEILSEKIFLGLRSKVGVKISILTKEQLQKVEILEKNGKIFIKNGRIFNKNFLLSDEISLFLTY